MGGGFLLTVSGHIHLHRTNVTGCVGHAHGAGVDVYAGRVTLDGCYIADCVAPQTGAGVHVYGVDAILVARDTTITRCRGGLGGGLYVGLGDATIDDSRIVDNEATLVCARVWGGIRTRLWGEH